MSTNKQEGIGNRFIGLLRAHIEKFYKKQDKHNALYVSNRVNKQLAALRLNLFNVISNGSGAVFIVLLFKASIESIEFAMPWLMIILGSIFCVASFAGIAMSSEDSGGFPKDQLILFSAEIVAGIIEIGAGTVVLTVFESHGFACLSSTVTAVITIIALFFTVVAFVLKRKTLATFEWINEGVKVT